jgi:uncharacterized protein (TIRG00374 family)
VKRRYALGGFIISLILLGWLLKGVEWSQVREAFARVQLLWVGLIAAIVTTRLVIHAWRWTYLLEPVHPLGFGLCFRATGVGFLSSMLLPAQAGAVVRAVMAGESGRVPASSVFATVVLERLVGTILLLPLMVLAVVWVEPPMLGPATKASLQAGLGFSVVAAAALGLLLWGLMKARHKTQKGLKRALFFLPAPWIGKILGWLEAFVGGLKGLPRGRALASFTTLSVTMWGCWFTGNLCLFKAFSLPLPLSAALMLMLLQFLSFSLPGGPGVLGSYHVAATTAGLLLYGISSGQAISAAVVLRVAISATVVLIGLSCLLAESALAGRRVKLTDLAQAGVAPRPEGA